MAQSYTKPAVRNAWGDTASNSDLVDPGNSFASAGWPIGAKPPRQYFNWVLNVIHQGVRYLCQAGISAWDAADVYSTGGIVRGPDGLLYQSKQSNNTNQTPASAPNFWGPLTAASPAAADNSSAVPTTAWVSSGFIPKGAPFSQLSGTVGLGQISQDSVTQYEGALQLSFSQLLGHIANSQILAGAVTQFQTSLSIAWSQLTGTKNADQLNGVTAGPLNGFTGNTLARNDASGNLYAQYHNQASPNNENPTISQVMVTNGTDNFVRKASVAAVRAAMGALTAADFTALVAAHGYQKLPSGIIIQWGGVTVSGSAGVSFPLAFPTECAAVAVVPVGTTNQFFLAALPGSASFTITNGSGVVLWIAIGF